jgi:calcyphosin
MIGGGKGGPLDEVMNKLRQRLASRGARGFIGVQKQFKIMDDDNSGNIDISEFRKAMKDFRIDLNENEIQLVFSSFDRDGSGTIDYDEFVRGVRGPMN